MSVTVAGRVEIMAQTFQKSLLCELEQLAVTLSSVIAYTSAIANVSAKFCKKVYHKMWKTVLFNICSCNNESSQIQERLMWN
jgi:hypothetical protein